MTLKGFFKECHKKEVFKMLSIYIVSSWVILQVLALVSDPLELPKKTITYLILFLLIGFPVYIYCIWKYKLLQYEIQQTQDPNTPYNKSAFQKMYFSSLFIVGLVVGISSTLIIKNSLNKGFSLEQIESNNKIAVLEFENTTTNKSLNNVGKIASNWITHGITENQLGQVISSKLINDYTTILKLKEGSKDLNNLLKNYFKPDKVIEGVYYEENNKLLLQGSIKDGLIDETLISFETIICDPNYPLNCAEKLKQEILGYLSTEDRQEDLGYIKNENNALVSSYYEEEPPNYEAYQYVLNALENEGNDKLYLELLNKSIQIDADYFEPKIHKMSYYYNKGNFKILDSLTKEISTNSKLNNRQRNWMLFYEAILSGKNDKVYKAIKNEYKKAYKDLATNMSTMTIVMQYVNKPEDIEAIYNEIPMQDIILENCSNCGFRYYLKALADIELSNYDDVIKTLVPITNTIEDNYLKRPLIMAYIQSGKYSELEKYISDYELVSDTKDINELNVFTGIQFAVANKPEKAEKHFNKVILNTTENDSLHVAKAFYCSKDYKNAQNYYEILHQREPKNINFLVQLAISNYKNGENKSAENLINKLDELRTDFQFGAVDYAMAQYYASIEDTEKALQFLLKAVSQGFNYTPLTFQNDPHFIDIKNTPYFTDRIMNYWKNKI